LCYKADGGDKNSLLLMQDWCDIVSGYKLVWAFNIGTCKNNITCNDSQWTETLVTQIWLQKLWSERPCIIRNSAL